MPKKINPYLTLVVFAILGTAIRIAYGLRFEPWWQAPDQLAWEMLIGEGSFSYSHFIHYPHEGGSILLSCLARFIQLFTNFHSLTVAAIIIYTLSRLIQLFVIKKVFGNQLAYTFGIWGIFAIPLLLPWGTVNYGLHALSSFFPFIFLYLLSRKNIERKNHLLMGLFLGIALWFHYSNALLSLVYILYFLLNQKQYKNVFWGTTVFCSVLFIHWLVRQFFDPGFQLSEFNGSIRGTSFEWNQISTYKRLYEVWFNALSDSAIAGVKKVEGLLPLARGKTIWTILLLLGSVIALQYSYTKNKKVFFTFLLVPIFICVYAISPFYSAASTFPNYVSVRHLAYIIPLFVLLGIYGLQQIRFGKLFISLFILIGTFHSSALFFNKPINFQAIRAAGWVVGIKMGHSPEQVEHIIQSSTYDQDELYIGIGWGLALSLFEDIDQSDTAETRERISRLYDLLNQYPAPISCELMKGINYGFSDHVRPLLDKKVYRKFLNQEEALYHKN